MNKKIILASASPRRTEILTLAKINHEVIVKDHKEVIDQTKTPIQIVKSLAYQKAKAVFDDYQDDIVIGADTIVVCDKILGKPKDRLDAYKMLKMLSNKTHQVITGVAILSKERISNFAEVTNVTFKEMSDEDIYEYIDSENVYDKAGAYAIQGMAGKFISKIEGDYYNVVGLPMCRVSEELRKLKMNAPHKNEIVIIGGSNIDYVGDIPKNINVHESNIGTVETFFGGVSRNIAENLARNGANVSFVTCIADDALGKAMKAELESIGIDLYIPENIKKTGSFLSINKDNDLFVGICDVNYQQTLTEDYIESLNLIDENTKYLIIDTNLPEELITYICNKYSDKYIIADGISSKKVVRLKPVLDKLSLLKVNVYEGETLTKESKPELIIKSLINKGLKTCIVTSGSNPTVYNVGKEIKMEPTLKIKKEEIVNTTGAGDSMLSGTVLGLTLGYDMTNAVKIGHIFANANLKVNTPTLKERTLN